MRGVVPETRMEPASIIEQFDVSGNLPLGYLTGWELLPVDELDLERPVRRFREGVIVANPGPAHGLANTQSLENGRELIGRVVAASVGIKPSSA